MYKQEITNFLLSSSNNMERKRTLAEKDGFF